MQRKLCLTTVAVVLLVGAALVASNIHPVHKFGWGENTGWLNWRDADDGAGGVIVGETYLSGFIWAENVGWINVGEGSPDDGIHYANEDNTNSVRHVFCVAWLSPMAFTADR
jgi:hypothetical protein